MLIKHSPEEFIVEEIDEKGNAIEVNKEHTFEGGEGEHLIFILEKRNWGTIDAVKELAKRLHISQSRIGYAGTKDRRAWTAQLVSAWNVKREELEKVRIKDITLWPLKYSDGRLSLGDLQGNRFTITIHQPGKLKEITEILNYFGEQRFGATRPVTHLVGMALVNEQYKKAVDTYLYKWFDTEREADMLARRRLEQEGDYKAALSYFPTYLGYERALLSHLSAHPNDYVNALRSLPRKLLVMFVHAYQSYLFNRVLDRRKKMGIGPMEGDILENGVPTGPLFGYESELAGGAEGEIENAVLEEDWLQLKDFRLHGMPDLSSKGMRRPFYVPLNGFRILKEGDPLTVRFSLPKGCYATTALMQLFPDNADRNV